MTVLALVVDEAVADATALGALVTASALAAGKSVERPTLPPVRRLLAKSPM